MYSTTKKPKAILLDWDETLAHTRNCVVESIEYTLKKYNKEPWNITKNKYRDTKKSLKENFPNFFGKNANTAYNEYIEHYTQNSLNKVYPMEDANKFLTICTQQNIDLFIISNKEKSLLTKEVAICFPHIPFKKILGNDDATLNKPDAAPVFEALRHTKYEINKDNIWFIGDSKQDIECAYNACIQPILLGKGNFMDNNYVKDKANSSFPLLAFKNFNEITFFLLSKIIL